jgi:uncharacterized protein
MANNSLKNERPIAGNRVFVTWQRSVERFLKIRGQPREIALGLALGLFIGMTPFMGFQMAIAVFFAALLKWNKLSSAIGVWISNPVTAPIIYPLTYWIGAKMVGIEKAYRVPEEFSWSIILRLFQKSPEILGMLILGGIVVGIPLAVAGYFFAYTAVKKSQDGIKQKLAERRERRVRIKKTKKKKRRKRN